VEDLPLISIDVIITNYNYGRYVTEAVESALRQTRSPRRVIVIDDGSTDDSAERLQGCCANDPRVVLQFGDNAGQCAGFKRGVALAEADVVAFLDADDRWAPDYLARVGAVYDGDKDIDFVFTDVSLFGNEYGVHGYATRPVDLGYTALSTWMTGWWYGEASSAISMRRRWAVRALDLPQGVLDAWRLSGDAPLVFGSSILGARKYFVPTGSVHYRVHGKNGWWNARDRERRFENRFRARTVINYYAREMSMDHRTMDLVKLEFLSKVDPSRDEAARYARMALQSGVWLPRRIWRAVTILKRAGPRERRAETLPPAQPGQGADPTPQAGSGAAVLSRAEAGLKGSPR
jgi:glycosyltransferase involved in cell wall biosynthesis